MVVIKLVTLQYLQVPNALNLLIFILSMSLGFIYHLTRYFTFFNDGYRSIWFEAATVVAVPPPVEIPAGSVLRSALAGGLSCALSTSLMFPIDTIKANSWN